MKKLTQQVITTALFFPFLCTAMCSPTDEPTDDEARYSYEELTSHEKLTVNEYQHLWLLNPHEYFIYGDKTYRALYAHEFATATKLLARTDWQPCGAATALGRERLESFDEMNNRQQSREDIVRIVIAQQLQNSEWAQLFTQAPRIGLALTQKTTGDQRQKLFIELKEDEYPHDAREKNLFTRVLTWCSEKNATPDEER